MNNPTRFRLTSLRSMCAIGGESMNRTRRAALSITAYGIVIGAVLGCRSGSEANPLARPCASYCAQRAGEVAAVRASLDSANTSLVSVRALPSTDDAEAKRSGGQARTSCIEIRDDLAVARGQVLGMSDACTMFGLSNGNEANSAATLEQLAHQMPSCVTSSPAQIAAFQAPLAAAQKEVARLLFEDPDCPARCISAR